MSKIHLDARTKLVIVLCLSTMAVIFQDLFYLFWVFAIAVLISFILGSPIFSILNRIRKCIYVFIMLVIIQSIFSPAGDQILGLGNISLLTVGGIKQGMGFMLRMLIIVISAGIMLTMTSQAIVYALVKCKIPYEIAFMTSMAIRFIPMLKEEIEDALTAIQLRGIVLDNIGSGRRMKIYSYILMPAAAGVLIKAKKISASMETKAFGAYPQRTYYYQYPLNTNDYIVMIMSMICTLSMIAIYFM